MRSDIFRVAIIGPESSGKTTLCAELALHYKTRWVPEYSRYYIEKLGRKYTKEDILYCAKMQLETEEDALKDANKIFFADTELIIAKVWLLDLFHECPGWIDEMIIEKKYDLYLLTRPDIPFVDDPVRENPHRREFFFEWYKKELEKIKADFKIIEGIGKSRLENAIRFIDYRIKN